MTKIQKREIKEIKERFEWLATAEGILSEPFFRWSFGDCPSLPWMLLQITRPVMKQVYMKQAVGIPVHKRLTSQTGLANNVVCYLQAPVDHTLVNYTDEQALGENEGDRCCTLPPTAGALREALTVAFTGADTECVKDALWRIVDRRGLRRWWAAYRELKLRCGVYAWAHLDKTHLDHLGREDETGFPAIFGQCLAPLRMESALRLQEGGPAQAKMRRTREPGPEGEPAASTGSGPVGGAEGGRERNVIA